MEYINKQGKRESVCVFVREKEKIKLSGKSSRYIGSTWPWFRLFRIRGLRVAFTEDGMALINYAPKPIRSSTESHERPITRLTGWKRNYSREGEHRQWNSMHGNACVENFVTGRARAAHAPRAPTSSLSTHATLTAISMSQSIKKKEQGKRMKKEKKVTRIPLHESDRSKAENMHHDYVRPLRAHWLQAFVLAINLHARFIGVFT